MYRYLAEARLEHHLAILPKTVELKGRKICGELGEEKLEFASLREPPHKIFVNWTPTPESILEFTRKYGLLDPTGKHCWWQVENNSRRKYFSFSVASWVANQESFRWYWDGGTDWATWDVARLEMAAELSAWGAPENCMPGIELNDIRSLGPKPILIIQANTLWHYLCTLLVFHKFGDLRVCQNPECPAPRFIARRKDQVFCGGDCAGLVAKRRWWAKHGNQWRRRRTQKALEGIALPS